MTFWTNFPVQIFIEIFPTIRIVQRIDHFGDIREGHGIPELIGTLEGFCEILTEAGVVLSKSGASSRYGHCITNKVPTVGKVREHATFHLSSSFTEVSGARVATWLFGNYVRI